MIAMLLAVAWVGDVPPTPLPAWGYDVHRLICEITWRELTPRARQGIQDLMAGDPAASRFAETCIWADEIREDSAYARYRTAHYLNVPPGAAAVDPRVHCRDTYCVLEAIDDLVKELEGGRGDRRQRWEAIKFLAHFVADLHQPLHVGRPADRGGNETRVVFLGEPTNLHVVWDASLAQRHLLDPWDASRLHALITPIDRTRWQELDPVRWATESYAITERIAYREVETGSLGSEYAERARYVIEERILQAGYRLGLLLNRLLDR